MRNILYDEIMTNYNHRIREYHLNLPPLDNEAYKETLEIQKFKISETIDNRKLVSGAYRVYPRVFLCETCNDYKVLAKEDWQTFNPNKCPNCGGKYTQISILGFCDVCGNVETISAKCPKCGNFKNFELIRDKIEAPGSWKFKCKNCGKSFNFAPYPCNHKMVYNSDEKLCDLPAKKFDFINVRRGGLFKSCVKTIVDVPENKSSQNDSEYIDEIIICKYFNKWYGLDLEEGEEVEDLKDLLQIARDYPPGSKKRKRALRRNTPEEYFLTADKAKEKMEEVREKYKDISLSDITDYLILKSDFLLSNEYDDQDEEKLLNQSLNDCFKEYYNLSDEKYIKFLNKFGLEDITYIPDIQLISSAYGYIKGINKFYEEGFVPHFEPLRPYDYERNRLSTDKLKIYSYPYETEGIMFDLDKKKLVNWLIDNFNNEHEKIESEKDAKEYLFNLKEEEKEYKALKTLIHSFAHVLIKRSSLYTGLNEDSCSELLFPKNGAFMIYSTSNINIGGFLFVFENSIMDWFNQAEIDISECIFDPNCINEGGACFSCMYLPEFVCTDFNRNLDRNVFLGNKKEYKKGYWEYSD